MSLGRLLIKSQLYGNRWLMSALPPKADIDRRNSHVRFVPKADIRIAANLFDHLVGDLLELDRHVETEHECRLRVDDELELARLHNRQFCRLRTLEDAASVDASLTIGIRDVGSVAHQSTRFDRLAIRKRGRNCMACRQSDKLCTPDDV